MKKTPMSTTTSKDGRASMGGPSLADMTLRELLAELAALESAADTSPDTATAERAIRGELERRRLSSRAHGAHPSADDVDLLDQEAPAQTDLDDDQYPRAPSPLEGPH